MDSLQMDNDLIEVRVFFLELLFELILVQMHDLLFHPNKGSRVLLTFLLHVSVNHVSERRFGLDDSDLSQSSNDNVLDDILKSLNFGNMSWVFPLQFVFWHNHDVVKWVRLVLLYCLFFEL